MKMKRKINRIKTPGTSISTNSASNANTKVSSETTPKSVVKPTASAISSALGNCAPCSKILAARIPKVEAIQIMRPQKNEAYMIAPGDGLRIACLINRLEDDEGRFIGEEFYPVSANIQPFIASDIRLLNFQVGITEFGKHFIDCQKLASIDGKSDGWAEY